MDYHRWSPWFSGPSSSPKKLLLLPHVWSIAGASPPFFTGFFNGSRELSSSFSASPSALLSALLPASESASGIKLVGGGRTDVIMPALADGCSGFSGTARFCCLQLCRPRLCGSHLRRPSHRNRYAVSKLGTSSRVASRQLNRSRS